MTKPSCLAITHYEFFQLPPRRMSSSALPRQVLRLASGKQFPLQCAACGLEPCSAISASSAFPTDRSIISASCGFRISGNGQRGQLGLGWDQRSASDLTAVPVTSQADAGAKPTSRGTSSPTAYLQQAFTLLLDSTGTAHIAGDGMDCVFGVGGSMGVVGSYHGGAQPVAKAEFQPVEALQHKELTSVCTTKRSVVAVARSGHVYTWGSGYQGELGQGHATVATAPTLLPMTEDAAEDAASMMMPPADEHRIVACVAGDGFVALASAAGQVYVTGSLGPKYAGGVRSTVQVSPQTAENVPPPVHLQAGNAFTGGACAPPSVGGGRPQASRPTLLAKGAPVLAAGKHHLVLGYNNHVLVAGDNSACQATAEALPVPGHGARFPLWRALGAEQLPPAAHVTAVYAYGDCCVVEVRVQQPGRDAVRGMVGWGALPAGMAAMAVPLPAADAPCTEWESFGSDGSAAAPSAANDSTGHLPVVTMETRVHSAPVLLRLPHVSQSASVLGWWQGELLFA